MGRKIIGCVFVFRDSGIEVRELEGILSLMNLKKLIVSAAAMSVGSLTAAIHEADVIIYGGTSASVIAAVQVKKMGSSVIVVSPDRRIGGLSSGGLGWTDTGDKTVIGGLSRDFYHRIYRHYQEPDAWKFQEQSEYGGRARAIPRPITASGRCGFSSQAPH